MQTSCSRCGRGFPFGERDTKGRCPACQAALAAADLAAIAEITTRAETKRVARRKKQKRKVWTRHSFVYRFYDESGTLLYVGKANQPNKRFYDSLTSHSTTKEWWPEVVEVKLACYTSEAVAYEAERHIIKWEDPLYNKDRSGPHTDTEPTPIYTVTGSI